MSDVNPDADLHNADWLRTRTWDIFPVTGEGLLAAIGATGLDHNQQAAALGRFMRTPAAQAMPESVKSDLRKMGLLA